MRDLSWEHMSDAELDQQLTELLPELPPDEVSGQVDPWHKPMTCMVWGLGLCSILLPFYHLDVIFPALGWLLLVLGLRVLRRENRCFTACWLIASAELAFALLVLILNSSIICTTVYATKAFQVLRVVLILAQPVMDLALWLGLRTVRRRAGLTSGGWPALALFCWHLLVLALAVMQVEFAILALVLLGAYAGILVSLHRLSGTLDQAGYVIETAGIRISDLPLTGVLTGVTVAGVLCGLLLGQRYFMDWSPVTEEGDARTQQVGEQLLELGFPENVLADLSREELLALEGATRVVTGTDLYPVNEGREVVQKGTDGELHYTIEYDVKELRITGVAVQLPGDRERWQLIHHFCWEAQPEYFGTESIQIIPADYLREGWERASPLTGRLLCQRDGLTLEAPYRFLGEKDIIPVSLFGEAPVERTDLFAAFSLPPDAQRQRGYVSYAVSELNDGWILNSWGTYSRRATPFLYPSLSAMAHQISGAWDLEDRYQEVDTAIQFYPFREGDVLFGYEDGEDRQPS